jgi:hypothetical protein
MSRAEELRALADEYERHDGLVSTYVAAQDAHRANPDDESIRAAYRDAAQVVTDSRRAMREAEGRSATEHTIGGDAFVSTPPADAPPEG